MSTTSVQNSEDVRVLDEDRRMLEIQAELMPYSLLSENSDTITLVSPNPQALEYSTCYKCSIAYHKLTVSVTHITVDVLHRPESILSFPILTQARLASHAYYNGIPFINSLIDFTVPDVEAIKEQIQKLWELSQTFDPEFQSVELQQMLQHTIFYSPDAGVYQDVSGRQCVSDVAVFSKHTATQKSYFVNPHRFSWAPSYRCMHGGLALFKFLRSITRSARIAKLDDRPSTLTKSEILELCHRHKAFTIPEVINWCKENLNTKYLTYFQE